MTDKKQIPVLVTTEHRGVFFGYAESQPGSTMTLARARNCLYWPRENKGFLGLATIGPQPGARVGPAADRLTLFGVTAVVECSPEAVQAWEAEPWKA